MRSAFWSRQCPARGIALTHAHWSACTAEEHPGEDSGHLPFQCCHCRGLDPAAKATVNDPLPEPQVAPPIDVVARLRALGIMGDMTLNRGPEPAHDDDTPVEPKAITGEGPQGLPWEIGRGDLTPRQKVRVTRYVEFARWRGDQNERWRGTRSDCD